MMCYTHYPYSDFVFIFTNLGLYSVYLLFFYTYLLYTVENELLINFRQTMPNGKLFNFCVYTYIIFYRFCNYSQNKMLIFQKFTIYIMHKLGIPSYETTIYSISKIFCAYFMLMIICFQK